MLSDFPYACSGVCQVTSACEYNVQWCHRNNASFNLDIQNLLSDIERREIKRLLYVTDANLEV